MSKTKPHGALFDKKPSFETDAPANKYDLDYKGKHIARIYHKVKTDRPSGVYIEPNYKNMAHGQELLRRLIDKKLEKDIYIWSTDVKHNTGLDRGVEAYKERLQKQSSNKLITELEDLVKSDNQPYPTIPGNVVKVPSVEEYQKHRNTHDPYSPITKALLLDKLEKLILSRSVGQMAGIIPPRKKGNPYVMVVNPKFDKGVIVKHELGHAQDFQDKNIKNNFDLWRHLLVPGNRYKLEQAAWYNSGVTNDNPVRQFAMKSYQKKLKPVDYLLGKKANSVKHYSGINEDVEDYKKMQKEAMPIFPFMRVINGSGKFANPAARALTAGVLKDLRGAGLRGSPKLSRLTPESFTKHTDHINALEDWLKFDQRGGAAAKDAVFNHPRYGELARKVNTEGFGRSIFTQFRHNIEPRVTYPKPQIPNPGLKPGFSNFLKSLKPSPDIMRANAASMLRFRRPAGFVSNRTMDPRMYGAYLPEVNRIALNNLLPKGSELYRNIRRHEVLHAILHNARKSFSAGNLPYSWLRNVAQKGAVNANGAMNSFVPRLKEELMANTGMSKSLLPKITSNLKLLTSPYTLRAYGTPKILSYLPLTLPAAVGGLVNYGINKLTGGSTPTVAPLAKTGASKYPSYPKDLKPYQIRAIKRMADPATTGLVVAHGTGTGKTRTAIETTKALKMPTNVVVPAALQENYRKELMKWTGGVPANANIISQQRVARQGLNSDPRSLMIVDEAHRARENSSALYNTLRYAPAKKRMFLTATPVFNHAKDLATLVNMASGKNLLPTNKSDFDYKYVDYKKVSPGILGRVTGIKPGLIPQLKNKNELSKILNKYVDYYPGSTEGFPSSTEETVKVPIGPRQQDVYKSIMGTAPWWVRQKVKFGLPPGKNELETMRAFLNGVRQVSNSNRAFVRGPSNYEETKIQNAFNFLKGQIKNDPSYKGVVYSNFLQSGLNPYKSYLDKNKIPYGEFSGNINSKVRDDLVRQYNANKLKALLISSAGAEGLDLKGTRLIQILEPHFNEEKEKQIIGRGIRYGSHAALTPAQRHVLVQRYIAEPRQSFVDKILGRKTHGVDEYIRNIALQKSKLTKEVTSLLAQQNQNLQ